MESSTGFRKFAYRWLIRQHYKRRILISLCPKRTLERKFKQKLGYKPNLKDPKTFNEKLSWFKLFVRDPMITKCADKYAVRDYVIRKIGEDHLVPLLGVFHSVEEISIEKLPQSFVFKPNHESGRVIICHDKDKINWRKKADIMKNWLRENYYYQTGEWGYKDIPPKILCEKLLQGEVIDYKFFCFNGEPFLVDVIKNRTNINHYNEIFTDLNFNMISQGKGREDVWRKPQHWEEMIEMAKLLSKDFPFVRVDLYDLEGKVYFGELTFTPADGMDKDLPKELDIEMGELYNIRPFIRDAEKKGKVVKWCTSNEVD